MRQYFKGYYFKCCERESAFALIPALHNDGKKCSATLQVITNDGAYIIPCHDIEFKDGKIKIGKNRFSSKGISLDVDSKGLRIYGNLSFSKMQKIRYDIMGPFKYIPRLQCRHSIVSMKHCIKGEMVINDAVCHFNNGTGYIEGDSGVSFPREYIWTQCHFKSGSLMLAVADVPFMGLHFKGIIGVIIIAGREYRIATYLGAKAVYIGDNNVVIKQGKYTFYAKLIKEHHHGLNAPVNGKMARIIHESISCRAFYKFVYQNRVLLEFESNKASFEYEMKAK